MATAIFQSHNFYQNLSILFRRWGLFSFPLKRDGTLWLSQQAEWGRCDVSWLLRLSDETSSVLPWGWSWDAHLGNKATMLRSPSHMGWLHVGVLADRPHQGLRQLPAPTPDVWMIELWLDSNLQPLSCSRWCE